MSFLVINRYYSYFQLIKALVAVIAPFTVKLKGFKREQDINQASSPILLLRLGGSSIRLVIGFAQYLVVPFTHLLVA